ncbi:MAG TPA: DUF4412 domain-containing protein [Polyangiaceae bacterium]|nr:DUF4412 domain-containing protein [Polyangiaceae bacterium]
MSRIAVTFAGVTLVCAIASQTTAARATPSFPDVIAARLAMSAPPPCTTCHETEAGGAGTATRPFALYLESRGLRRFDESSLDAALQAAAGEAHDTNADGVSDLVAIARGEDPNAGAVSGPAYGCGAHVARSAPGSCPRTAVPCAAVLVVLALYRLVYTRRSMNIRNPRALMLGMSALLLVACGKSKSSGSDPSAAGSGAAAAPGGKGPLSFLNGFEGEIGIAVKSIKAKSDVPPLTLLIKGDRVRADIPAGLGGPSQPGLKGYAILSAPEKKLSVVMDDRKQVLVLDLNSLGDQIKAMKPGVAAQPGAAPAAKEPPPTLTKTGATDKVAGYACDNWEVTQEKRKVATLCIADESASWFRLPLTGIPTEYAWALELFDGKHFPLRAIGYEKDGSEAGRIEVTKLEKKAIAAATFEVPPSYKVVDLGSMMAGMMGALPRGGMPPGFPPGGIPGMGQSKKAK